jgi:hypothetical protein
VVTTSGAAILTVNPLLPVSVTVAPSANPVCAGTSVTFTATPTNGGAAPAYQWKVNGINAGANSPTYAYVPLNNDVITCVLTSNITPCPSGNPATSAAVTMTVNPLLPVSVTVAPSANPVCAGTSVTFTATPTNGGAAPAYQWKVNGINAGANSPTYAYVPLNNDVITCVLTSNITPCATGNPATSAAVTMTVNPLLPVSVTVAPSANPVCAGTSVTFTATPTNGGAAPAYQWKVNGINAGANSPTYAYVPLNNDVITCVLTSNAVCPSGNPATSAAVTMTVNPLLPVSVTVAPSANPVCPSTSVTFTATPTNGGAAPAYQWKVNGINAGANSPTYAYTPLNNDVITCVLTSNITPCPSGNPATSAAVTMTVNPLLPVSVTVAPSANPVCAGTSVTFTATPTNGGAAPAYQWKVNGINAGANSPTYAYVPLNNDVITCVLTSSLSCATGNPATSAAVTMTVNPLLPVSVTVAPSANPVCAGTSVTFTATPTNGGAAPAYQWKVNGINAGANSPTYAYVPLNNDVITCVLTSNAVCPTGNPATSAAVTMTVNPLLPVSVTIAPSANPVCAGTSVTFTATPTNGGAAPAYQWKVNGINAGANSPTYAYVPLNNDVITCVLTSNITPCATGNPATSAAVTMTVNPLKPVSVTVAPSANPVCAGTSVTFTATPTNGGAAPAYQWKVNGINAGANSPTYAYVPLNNDVITCVLTSNITPCATGNPATSAAVTMTVNPLLPVSVTVAPSANPVCAGTSVTFTATPTNGGAAPAYQWKVNGINAGANSPTYAYVPLNNDVITCVLTSNITPCATGNPATSAAVTMTVNPLLPVSVTVAPSANPVCAGTSVTFTATPTNGGAAPAYQWKVNGINSGANSPTYAYTPLNNDVITCVLTSNITPCATGNPATSAAVTMTVNPLLPVSVTVAPSANPVCAGTSVTFTATPTNGGAAPAYQWKVNGINAGANSPTYAYVPLNNDVITCVLTSNAVCPSGNPATSAAVTMTVNPLLPVSVTVAPSANPVCAGTSVTFTATPTNGGAAPAYQWKVNGINAGANSPTYAYVPLNNDVITCVLTSNITPCATGNPATSAAVTMTVNPLKPVSVTVAPSANPVCAGTSVTFTATPTNGGAAPAYQWKVNGINAGANSPTYAYVPLNNDVITCVLTSNITPCATGNPATSAAVTMTVNPLLPVSVTVAPSANPVCAGTSVTFTATPTNGGAAPAYQWKVNGINAGANSPTYAYVPLNNDVITCVLTSNAVCPTGNPATSAAVTMTVNPLKPVSVTVAPSANPVCAGTSVTFTATPTNGGAAPAYQWKVNGINAGANSPTYAYVPLNNDVITCVLTSNITPCATGNPATSAAVTMTVNPLKPVSVTVAPSANPVCAGTSVTFTATPTNGGAAPAYQWKVNGINAGANSPTYTYVPLNNDVITCVLTSNAVCPTGNPATSAAVTMTVNSLLPVSVTVAPSANPVCPSTSVTFTATPTNGGAAPAYQWKVNGINAGANSPTYAYVPLNNDIITCVLTSSLNCATGNPATSAAVTMTVNLLLPVSVTVAPSANPVCPSTSVTFTATPTNGGAAPAYQWKVNGINTGANSPTYAYTPLNNDVITCVLTSNITPCATGNPATSNAITMIVVALPSTPAIAGGGKTDMCKGTNGQFYSVPLNAGNTYTWSIVPATTIALGGNAT